MLYQKYPMFLYVLDKTIISYLLMIQFNQFYFTK